MRLQYGQVVRQQQLAASIWTHSGQALHAVVYGCALYYSGSSGQAPKRLIGLQHAGSEVGRMEEKARSFVRESMMSASRMNRAALRGHSQVPSSIWQADERDSKVFRMERQAQAFASSHEPKADTDARRHRQMPLLSEPSTVTYNRAFYVPVSLGSSSDIVTGSTEDAREWHIRKAAVKRCVGQAISI